MASGESAGQIRILFRDATTGKSEPVLRVSTAAVSQGVLTPVGVNRSALPTLAELGGAFNVVGADGREVVWQMLGTAAATVESEESNIQLALVLTDVATGATENRLLTGADFAGFNEWLEENYSMTIPNDPTFMEHYIAQIEKDAKNVFEDDV